MAKSRSKKRPMENKKKLFIWGGISAAVLSIVVIALILMFSGEEKENHVVYLKGDELYFSNLDDVEPWQLSNDFITVDDEELPMIESVVSDLTKYIQVSKDGNKIFYVDNTDGNQNGYTLLCRNADGGETNPIKIDDNITFYKIDEKGECVTYVKNGALYQSDLEKSVKRESEIKDLRFSDDGNVIVYMDSEYTVYLKEMGKEAKKVDTEVSSIMTVSKDGSSVYYSKGEELYKKDAEGKSKKLASDVYRVVKIYETGEIYYLAAETNTICLADYVNDDMKEADANLVEPVFPSAADYNSDEEYLAAYDAYEKEMGAVCDKQFRDELRVDLKNEKAEQVSYNLCYYHDGKVETVMKNVTDDMNQDTCATETPVVYFAAYTSKEIEHVKMSEVTDVQALKDMVTTAFQGPVEWYVVTGSKANKILQENGQDFVLSKDGESLFFLNEFSSKKQTGDLCRIKISNHKIGKVEKYDSDVYYMMFLEDGSLSYYKNLSDEGRKGTLYIDKKKIADKVDVGSAVSLEEGKYIYITKWDYELENGRLHSYNGEETEKISENVSRYEILPNGKVLYLTDYDFEKYEGNLYVWNKGDSKKIDEDVRAVMKVYK